MPSKAQMRRRRRSKGWYNDYDEHSQTEPVDYNIDDDPKSNESEEENIYAEESPGQHETNRTHRSGSQNGKSVNINGWAAEISGTFVSIDAARKSLSGMQAKLQEHLDDLNMIEQNKEKLAKLEELCREKDKLLAEHLAAITTLRNIHSTETDKLNEEREKLAKRAEELNREKIKMEKRTETKIAEQKKEMNDHFNDLVMKQGQSHEERKKRLEDEYQRKTEENSLILTALEAENKQLSNKVQEQAELMLKQEEELKKKTSDYDLLQRATDSFKNDTYTAREELERFKTAFDLKPRPIDEVQMTFSQIGTYVEEISMKYLSDPIENDDEEEVHNQLKHADPQFCSVPIDESEDSYNLRLAHAQRIISEAICEYIWVPFSSEMTASQQESPNILIKMMDALDQSNRAGRSSNVWTALSMKALGLLRPESVSGSDDKASTSIRGNKVRTKVTEVLRPLLDSSRITDFENELVSLAKLCIDVWDDAQTSEYRIKVNPTLNLAQQAEWRSLKFDPVRSSGDESTAGASTDPSSKGSKILLLFPRVEATIISDPSMPQSSIPGSFPGEPTMYRCLHPGKGLSPSSQLVIRGRKAQEEIEKMIKTSRKEARLRRNTGLSGRRPSTASSTSGLPSPTTQWRMTTKKLSE